MRRGLSLEKIPGSENSVASTSEPRNEAHLTRRLTGRRRRCRAAAGARGRHAAVAAALVVGAPVDSLLLPAPGRPTDTPIRARTHEAAPVGHNADLPEESGYSSRQGQCSYGRDDRCTFVLLCLLSGGTAAGRCGNSLLYTCCVRPPRTRSSLPADHASVQALQARSPAVARTATQRKYYNVDDEDGEPPNGTGVLSIADVVLSLL
ncbi:hypothetical protein HPB51_020802 [Rhipicephalus microplus]|uniref:Uncharacterized protein n=1 Tax=Rhipicephalus microplus TaxID=6941 RepID=A0A9J6DPS8_RHIMP|nr:hypothetical protein HPB51_020802 [Rhipicephalus microplus]